MNDQEFHCIVFGGVLETTETRQNLGRMTGVAECGSGRKGLWVNATLVDWLAAQQLELEYSAGEYQGKSEYQCRSISRIALATVHFYKTAANAEAADIEAIAQAADIEFVTSVKF